MKHSTLFIDESGKSSLAEKPGEPFLITGIILDDDEIRPIEGFFNYIKIKYGINPNKAFHSFHTFEKPDTKLTDTKAKVLIEKLADFISLIPIRIKVLSIDKEKFRRSLGANTIEDFKGTKERKEMKEYPYRIMSASLFDWFAKHIKRNNGIGQIIADSRRGGDTQLIKTLNLCKDNNGPLNQKNRETIKENCNAICFAEKNFLSGGLEITDLVSFVSFFNARSMMNTMNHIRLDLLWQKIRKKLKNGKIHKVTDEEIVKFFGIGADGVHKYLKD